MRRRKKLHNGLLVVVTIVVALVAAIAAVEIVLSASPASHIVQTGERAFGAERTLALREYRPSTRLAFAPPPIRSTHDENALPLYPIVTDRDGFIRSEMWHEAADATIVFLGGSTTEGMFVAPPNRFPAEAAALLSKRTGLKVNTLNGGRSGNNTMHANLLLTGKVLALRPTAVVLMENVNDMGTLSTYGTYWNASSDYALVRTVRRPIETAFRSMRDAVIPHTYRAIRRALRRQDDRSGAPERAASVVPEAAIPAEKSALWEHQYEMAVRQFVGTARAWRVHPVLMTQVWIGSPGERGDPGLLARDRLEQRGFNADSFAGVHARFNEIIRRVAQDEGAILIDLARAHPWTEQETYDGLHFSDAGSRVAATIISDTLGPWLALRSANRSP
ncbi:MAG: SGNH/GDSL hydrolase family protein [Alphaproteobacteria bacterium]|nr:SGNH/GDSL hydrolase family protein [Alphaproteobacteria bacterium]